MAEETPNVPENAKPEEVTVVVSEETIEKVDQEITKGEEQKLVAAKEEGKQEVSAEIEQMKKELEAIQAQNTAAETARKVEEQKTSLAAQIAAERAKAEQPVKKHLVAPADNPVAPVTPVATPEPDLSPEQQWNEFEKHFKGVSVSTKDII